VSPKAITAILRSASGENTLFDLDIQGKKRRVILKEYQVEPLKGALLHADFYEVALDKTLAGQGPHRAHGHAGRREDQGGILDFVTRELEIECLPPTSRTRSRSTSATRAGKHIRVSDLKLSDKVTILTEPELVIVHVVAPRAEEAAARGRRGCGRRRAAGPSPRSSRRARSRPRRGEGRQASAGEEGEEVDARRRRPREPGRALPPHAPQRRVHGRRRAARPRPAPGKARSSRRPGWRRRSSPARSSCSSKPLTFMNRSGVAVERLLLRENLLPQT
jgi:large subunit ribosomal protein L25